MAVLMRIALLVPALLASAALATGCGGSDESKPASSTATTTTVKVDPKVASDPRIKAAIQRCKDAIAQNGKLTDEIKQQFEDLCNQAVSGKPEELKKATRELCDKIVDQAVTDAKAREAGHKECATAAVPPLALPSGG